ncbi:MAG: iron-sulfur cluster-binding protein [Myxococcaceae bacterium]|nr:iron-sulfur cluster-binding protein [Myxococcaceae bacterium]
MTVVIEARGAVRTRNLLLRQPHEKPRDHMPVGAGHEQLPGENCLAEPGTYFPVIDRNRCEGKGACVRVCPQAVFEVRTIEGQDYDTLSFVGRVRNAMHGRKTAYTPNAAQCQACGLCVEACPEKAISLVTFG